MFLTIFLLVRPLGLLDTPDVWEHFSKLNWSNKKPWTFLWSPDMWKTFEDHNSWNKIFEFYRLGNHAKTVCSAKENSSRNSTLKHFTQKALTTNSSTTNSCKFFSYLSRIVFIFYKNDAYRVYIIDPTALEIWTHSHVQHYNTLKWCTVVFGCNYQRKDDQRKISSESVKVLKKASEQGKMVCKTTGFPSISVQS